MLNHIILMGRLTRDPELKTSTNGKPVALFSIACSRDYNREETDFFYIVAWGKTAEFVSKWFEKGQLIAVSGRLQTRRWTDKNGNDRITTEIIMHEGYFCESKNKSASSSEAQKNINASVNEYYIPDFEELSDDGNLPF